MLPTKHAANPGLIFSHSSLNTTLNFSIFLISLLLSLTRLPKAAQTCSIGFKSGLCAGQYSAPLVWWTSFHH
ncbi:hypothetical protein BCV72DRAFT_314790 [Rhizopus microsporus var. microsporus]|uniref:Uncharacterized protein n=2 Tax=Rhizopus microsporus TaxID=58291 RepID=A0A2G4T516_RHIZD|nr:uncharacterized protein RHIMIDRAFT_57381 [Rhizopus microsporus ATCC 52813]ORE03720.1 hypothetical protein BCV72DRAFT_314790 [Rhizopus microsporus var. microsporus]PHZ16099.1 hypothetical protein RHIMIDRAFT_57381 [Rhizopus microsporus ATCC 52813]